MYILIKNEFSNTIHIVFKPTDNACIPFDPNNADYQQFKKDLLNGAALNDAENNAMTAEQITTFLETLP